MKTILIKLGLLACIFLTAFTYSEAQSNLKKRVAILDFDLRLEALATENIPSNIQIEIADLINTALIQSKNFKVADRNKIRMTHASNGATTAEDAALVGQALGADLAVIGTILELGYISKAKDMALGKLELGIGKTTALINIDIRVIDTSSGEVVNAQMISKRKTGLSGGVTSYDITLRDKALADKSILGKAINSCVSEIINLLNSSAKDLPWSAKVVNADTQKVFINSGALDGIGIGTRLKVYRPGMKLIDPDTGLNLGSIDEELGIITIIDNSIGDGKASLCSIEKGTAFDTGDIVRRL